MAASFEFFVELIEDDVAEQRRERAALGRPFFGGLNEVVELYSAFQKRPDQFQDPSILDALFQSAQEPVMVNAIEEFRQIKADHMGVSFLNVLPVPFDCLGLRSSRPVPVGRVRECVIVDGHQGLHRGLLHKAVHAGRNTELSNAAIRFRDFLSPDGQRPVCAAVQGLLAGLPRAFDVSPELTAGHAVNAGGAVVGFDPFRGAHQQAAGLARHTTRESTRTQYSRADAAALVRSF